MDSCEVHICTFVATLVQLCHVAHWIYLGAEETAKERQACSPGGGAQRRGLGVRARARASHALKLVDALFGVARADLSEGLVLVPSSFHVLSVDDVVDRFLALIPSVGQL